MFCGEYDEIVIYEVIILSIDVKMVDKVRRLFYAVVIDYMWNIIRRQAG